MIDVYRSTPQIYYDNSRDFQFIARTLEALANHCKTAADMVVDSPFDSNTDVKLLPLLAKTLGFDGSHRYSDVEFRAICSSFVEIMRSKGTFKAIRKTVELFMTAKGVSGDYEVGYDDADKTTIIVRIPSEIIDTTLLEDVFDYILPAGMNYVISYSSSRAVVSGKGTYSDKAKGYVFGSGDLGVVTLYDKSGAHADLADFDTANKPTFDASNGVLGLTFTGVTNTVYEDSENTGEDDNG